MSNVVISTRVRLARNLKNYPFPCKLSQQGREEVIEKVRDAVKNGNSVLADDFSYIKMSELDPRQSVSLVEKRLVSPEFVSDTAGRALLLSSDERLSIMLNEEDHIRLQVITPGLSLEQAYDTADKLDTLLDERLDFAFDEKLGYLTQCPTNLGTGMRASVMLHLPALEKSNAISRIAGNLSKLGLIIRGAHGEGTEPKGAMYQLSNQITLGISEKAAIENLKNITDQLAAQEEQARERLCKHRRAGHHRTQPRHSENGAGDLARRGAQTAFQRPVGHRFGTDKGRGDRPDRQADDRRGAGDPQRSTAGKSLSPHESDVERAKL